MGNTPTPQNLPKNKFKISTKKSTENLKSKYLPEQDEQHIIN